MSIEFDLLEATATYLDGQGVGVYGLTGYQASDTAIVFGELPTSPDRVIALTVYGSNDDIRQPMSEFRVQFWCRGVVGSTVDAGDLASSVFDVLQGIQDRPWGSLWLSQCKRTSFIPMGIDDNQRAERSDNYVFRVNTPPTVGRPV